MKMAKMKTKKLPTWAARSEFKYDGSIRDGTDIHSGPGFRYTDRIPAEQYRAMLKHFSGQEVRIGTGWTDPPKRSVGAWLWDEYGDWGMMSYVGPILIAEGYAKRGSKSNLIRFNPK